MDEPLSNLDAKLRNEMRRELIKLHKRLDTTFMYVTHDQTEAMTLGDRIVVMKDGVIQQSGTPQEVYERPANEFVASFIGVPQINLFDAELILEDDRYYLLFHNHKLRISKNTNEILKSKGIKNQAIKFGIRPESIILTDKNPESFEVNTDVLELMGNEMLMHSDLYGEPFTIKAQTRFDIKTNDKVNVSFMPDNIYLFDNKTGCNLLY